MRTILIALMMTLATQAGAENLTYDDLVKRNKLYFKKFSNVPFSGEVFGKFSGSFKDGKKNGRWEQYYDNGQLALEGAYIDNKKNGLWKNYHSNGVLELQKEYLLGKFIDREIVVYFDSGKIRSRTQFLNQHRHGISRDYFLDGNLSKEENYQLGKRHGISKIYRSTGTLWIEKKFYVGQQEGPSLKYHPNGMLQQKMFFKDNKPHGYFESYYQDGKILSKGNYDKGFRVGEWFYAKSNGKLEKVVYDQLGKKLNSKGHPIKQEVNEMVQKALDDALKEAVSIKPPLTNKEIDNLRQSIQHCWNYPFDESEPTISITLSVELTEDGTVLEDSIKLIESDKKPSEKILKAYQFAKKALLTCAESGLALPKEKFEHWQTLHLTFDPKSMR